MLRKTLALLFVMGLMAGLAVAKDDYKLGPDSMEQKSSAWRDHRLQGLEERGLRRHRPRFLGLRSRPVRSEGAGLRHGLSGRRRLQGPQGELSLDGRDGQSHLTARKSR